MNKIATTGATMAVAIIILVGGGAIALVHAVFGTSSRPSAAALADIPADYLALYHDAATVCPGLDWSILAAIGKIESDHGRDNRDGVHSGENHAGAGGPMQFLKPTWDGVLARHQLPPGGATPPSRYNPHDAIYAAAYLLCDNGARDGRNIQNALWNYNHSDTYVREVLAQAAAYADTTSIDSGDCTNIQAPNAAAMTAVNYACGQQGLPYVWGGNGPAAGHAGFDCSGLTTAAYAAAGITLPRTAHTQYHAGPRVPDGEPLLPGDLIFYGNPNGKIHHVGLYIGGGFMIDAPDFGQTVGRRPYRHPGDDYAGATRPAGSIGVGSRS